MIYHYITGGRRNSYCIKYSDNIMINYAYMPSNNQRLANAGEGFFWPIW